MPLDRSNAAPLQRRSSVRQGVLLSIIIFLAGALLFCGRYEYRRMTIMKGYAKVENGMSDAEVREQMGEPNEIEPCRKSSDLDPCQSTYLFYVPIEKWGVDFDSDGKVIGKYYNVLY